MRRNMTRRLSYLLFALVLFAPARSAFAGPIELAGLITVDAKVDAEVLDLGNGFFQYSYTLKNPKSSPDSIFDFGLFFDGDPLSILAPKGWDFISGRGFIDWFDLGPEFDLQPAEMLSGFSFQSVLGPGLIKFQTTNADPTTGIPTGVHDGTTIGPSAVPEPGTLWLIATGALMALGALRKPA